MGINQWENEVNGTFRLTVEDERRLSVLNSSGTAFEAVSDVNETLFILPSSNSPQSFANYGTNSPTSPDDTTSVPTFTI